MSQSKFVFRVEYKSAINGRVARFFVKVPYGAAYGLSEVLMRAYVTGQVRWYRIADIKPGEMLERDSLTRWPEALAKSTIRTKVVFGQ